MRNRIAHLGMLELFHTGDDETNLTRFEHFNRNRFRCEYPNLLAVVYGTVSHQLNTFFLFKLAIHDTHQHHHAHVVIKPRVDNQRLQSVVDVAFGWRHAMNNRFQNFFNAHPRLCTSGNRIGCVNTNHVFNFLTCSVWISRGQIHFVKHWNHFQLLFNCGVAGGDGLCLNPLGSIHHQQRPFTGR